MKSTTLSLDSIEQLDNSRKKMKQGDLRDLMNSMKSDGLLQPIGVKPSDEYEDSYVVVFGNRRFVCAQKLGWTDIDVRIVDDSDEPSSELVLNLIENEHRSSLNDYERGSYYYELTGGEYELTASEVGARVGISTAKVNQCLRIFRETPKAFRDKISSPKKGRAPKAGKISGAMANKIIMALKTHTAITGKQKEQLFEYGRQDGVDMNHVRTVMKLINNGASFAKATKNADRVRMVTISVPVFKDDWQEMVTNYGSAEKLKRTIIQSLYGKAEIEFEQPN